MSTLTLSFIALSVVVTVACLVSFTMRERRQRKLYGLIGKGMAMSFRARMQAAAASAAEQTAPGGGDQFPVDRK